jgi:hypothetical protein
VVGCLKELSVAKLLGVERVDDRLINIWKGFGRKRSWLNRGTIPAFAWRATGKPREISVRILDVQDVVRNQNLLNTSEVR